jgi:hypothetical protein
MDVYSKVAALLKKEGNAMKAICVDCSRTKGEGKELQVITQPRLVSHHKHFHPGHIIKIIEMDDYNEFAFKKQNDQKSYATWSPSEMQSSMGIDESYKTQ